jgi:tRNA uridine 5-carboxymethylaminomethyl modification enzyme
MRVDKKRSATEQLIKSFRSIGVTPEQANPSLESLGSSLIQQQVKFNSLLTRPQVSLENIGNVNQDIITAIDAARLEHVDSVIQAEIVLKYEGYIQREEEQALKQSRLEDVKIPDSLDYKSIKSLSLEAVEKLMSIRPVTIGQASRVSGVSPSDISVLLIHLNH